MKRLSWKYVAGLIDGEGCIDVQVTNVGGESYVRPRVRIALVKPSEFVLEILKANHGGYLSQRPGSGNHQDSVCWELCGYGRVCMLLRNLVNHLFIKREQTRFCLWMEENIKGKHVSTEVRDAIRDELKLQKRDPHRLSERAQERILALL